MSLKKFEGLESGLGMRETINVFETSVKVTSLDKKKNLGGWIPVWLDGFTLIVSTVIGELLNYGLMDDSVQIYKELRYETYKGSLQFTTFEFRGLAIQQTSTAETFY